MKRGRILAGAGLSLLAVFALVALWELGPQGATGSAWGPHLHPPGAPVRVEIVVVALLAAGAATAITIWTTGRAPPGIATAAADARLVEALRLLPVGVSLYDADERLILTNGKVRIVPERETRSPPPPGRRAEAIIREIAASGEVRAARGREGAWIRDRLAHFRNPVGAFEIERTDGSWLRVVNEKTPDGGTVAIRIDITDEKNREKALAESEAQLRLVTDAMPALVAYVDRDHRVRFANRPYCEAVDRDRAEIVGKHLREVVGEEIYRKSLPRIAATLAGAFTENIGEAPGGGSETRFYRVIRVPHVGDDGGVLGYFVLLLDITEQKYAETQLRQALKMEIIGEITGGVAHDFNNLLTIILGNLELLKRHLGAVPQQALAEHAIGAALRGAELTHRLLAFSRRQPLQPRLLDLNALVAGLRETLARRAGTAVALAINAEAALWPCAADPDQLEAAIANLVANACEAMPGGGRLAVETANVTLGDGRAANGGEPLPGDYVALSVADTGAGMSAEVRKRAFDPFFTTKGGGAGPGLGLSMVYGFVRQSGGEVVIDSEPGRGTRVTIYLPRADAPAAGFAEEAGEEARPVRGETVLVVEDDADMRALAVALLRDLGYRVIEAASGAEALARLAGEPRIDLVLADVVLSGGIDGAALAATVRARWPAIPVVGMSGHPGRQPAHRERPAVEAGVLRKPFRKGDLARAVRAALDAGMR